MPHFEDRPVLPDGEYPATVVRSEIRPDKNGNDYNLLHWQLDSGEYVTTPLSGFWFQKLMKHFLKSTGLMVGEVIHKGLRETPDNTKSWNTTVLDHNVIGRRTLLVLATEPASDGYEARNKVTDIKILNGEDKLPVGQPEFKPFTPTEEPLVLDPETTLPEDDF